MKVLWLSPLLFLIISGHQLSQQIIYGHQISKKLYLVIEHLNKLSLAIKYLNNLSLVIKYITRNYLCSSNISTSYLWSSNISQEKRGICLSQTFSGRKSDLCRLEDIFVWIMPIEFQWVLVGWEKYGIKENIFERYFVEGKYLFVLSEIFCWGKISEIFCSVKKEAVRAAGRLPIHFVGRDDVVGAAQTLLTLPPNGRHILLISWD